MMFMRLCMLFQCSILYFQAYKNFIQKLVEVHSICGLLVELLCLSGNPDLTNNILYYYNNFPQV